MSMLTDTLIRVFNRDLNRLKDEINAYKDEHNLWLLPKGISNTAGNLAIHIVGNLNTYIGAKLGATGYIRQRDLEFSIKNVSREDIINQIDDVMVIIENTLKTLTTEDLEKEYRRRDSEAYMTTEFFLVHLTTHLNYHLGQINYHRRLLE
ncbi:DinB family protein [Winogradskyella immobilis]|nr:DinB family protein [Winogradskyella immobilis]